jgi:hypothetical protein
MRRIRKNITSSRKSAPAEQVRVLDLDNNNNSLDNIIILGIIIILSLLGINLLVG